MRLCGFLGHDCLLWKRSPFDKNTEAESPDNHCRVLLWDGPADTPIMFQTPCTTFVPVVTELLHAVRVSNDQIFGSLAQSE